MKVSCVLLLNLALVGSVPNAVALDATTRLLPHGKSSHLIQPRRALKHAATTGAAKPAAKHAERRHRSRTAGSRQAVGNGAPTIRRTRLVGRRHRYYERFTASSFATSDIFLGDIPPARTPSSPRPPSRPWAR